LQRLVSGLAVDRTAIGDAIGGIADLTNATAGLFDAARPPLKDSISGLGLLSQNLANSSGDLDRFLTLLPRKFTSLGRVGSYGSWLNMFLCKAVVETDPPGGVVLPDTRCTQQ
jgi:phospholipid/cholesterol/gamma-HCH transport system substrate-binding protein